jgi:hypothetical protein
MPLDAITRIDVLAKASQVGMNFTNMQNELYDDDEDSDSDEDSDDDSDYNYYDASSYDDDDDDYDDLIAGVDTENPGNSNPDAEEADENNNEGLSAGQGEDEALYDVSLSEENVNKDVPTSLKKLLDDTGALLPIIQYRTRQQAKETGESLMTGAEAIKTATKKQRKFRKELQIGLLKREEEENKKKLVNKQRNEKTNKNQERKGDSTQLGRTSANGNREQG